MQIAECTAVYRPEEQPDRWVPMSHPGYTSLYNPLTHQRTDIAKEQYDTGQRDPRGMNVSAACAYSMLLQSIGYLALYEMSLEQLLHCLVRNEQEHTSLFGGHESFRASSHRYKQRLCFAPCEHVLLLLLLSGVLCFALQLLASSSC